MPCLVYYEKLNDCEIMNCWEQSFSLHKTEIYKLWKDRVQQINVSSILVDISTISKNAILFLFDTLSKFESFNATGRRCV